MGAVLTIGTVLGVLAPVTGSTAAWADGPQHVKRSFTSDDTFSGFCDFDLRIVLALSDNVLMFPDGRMTFHATVHFTHTNLATGFTLTDTHHFTDFVAADGQIKSVGVEWHLRDPSGKLVVVQAGQLVFDSDGNVLRFTPNTNPDLAAVGCPALGGQPAS
jgi:hypothetical protein